MIVLPAGQFGDPSAAFAPEIAERMEGMDLVADLTRIWVEWGLLTDRHANRGSYR